MDGEFFKIFEKLVNMIFDGVFKFPTLSQFSPDILNLLS